MKRPRPKNIKIIVQTHPRKLLRDLRIGSRGSVFGNVMRVARQYGIKIVPIDGGLECSAPKSRMQIFVEKLHFSSVPYKEVD